MAGPPGPFAQAIRGGPGRHLPREIPQWGNEVGLLLLLLWHRASDKPAQILGLSRLFVEADLQACLASNGTMMLPATSSGCFGALGHVKWGKGGGGGARVALSMSVFNLER